MSYSPPSSAKPFTLDISEQDVSEWRQLLQLSKLPPPTWEGAQQDRRFGVSNKWLAETKDYWLNKFDWRAQEAHINSFPNYKMQIENVDLHFVALFSEKKDAIPVIFMHGWPGSFLEFLPMCDLIRKQYSAKDLPYHIIVPSLPGYTLSTVQSIEKNWTLEDSARINNQLMLNLGFDKYLAQGGDVGSFIARILSTKHDACSGIHLNMLSTDTPPDPDKLSASEKVACDRAANWRTTGMAYALEHCTRPSTIGSVLSSSPLALLAWIGEKFLEWTDEDPSIDTILTSISLYWFTSSFPRSIYPYRQLFSANRSSFGKLEKPTGFSMFPYEINIGIRSNLEKNANIVYYKQHEHGGHFAALEKPKEFWGDVEEFVALVWKPSSSVAGSRL